MAVIDIMTLGQAGIFQGGLKAGAKSLLKSMGIEFLSNGAALTVNKAGEMLNIPEPILLLLSLGTGYTVSGIGNNIVRNAKGEIIYEAEGSIKGGSKTISTVSDLSQEQINAIVKYTGDDYVNINNSLRGLETATSENKATIEAMQSALNKASLPQDMTLYRGTSTEALGNLKNISPEELVGKTFTESGFMSTSTNSAVASGTFSGNMQITIEASTGTHALDISSISQYSNETEILFNAGQEMLITSAESKNGILYITVLVE